MNAISTSLGVAALILGPHSFICGGLSIAIGLINAAQSDSDSRSESTRSRDYEYNGDRTTERTTTRSTDDSYSRSGSTNRSGGGRRG